MIYLNLLLNMICIQSNGAITIARMPNRNLGVRRVNGSYSGSIYSVLGAHWLFDSALGNSKNLLCMFKIIFIDHLNVASMCTRKIFGNHYRGMYVKRSRSMPLVLGAFGTPRINIEHDEPFPNAFRTLSGRFAVFWSIRKVKSTWGKYSVYLKAFGKHSVVHWGKTYSEGHSASYVLSFAVTEPRHFIEMYLLWKNMEFLVNQYSIT